VEAAWSTTHIKNCFFRRKYESLVGRRGKKRALIAVGHKILSSAYFIIKNKEAFKELGYDYPDRQRKDQQIEGYLKKLKLLGVDVGSING
jgi:transposase